MPNWCNNWTHFRHNDRAQAERMIEALDNRRLFQEFHPCPSELRDTTSPNRDETNAQLMLEKYGSADWYTWCVENWGTKWDTEAVEIPDIQEDEDEDGNVEYVVSISFDTAWSPPLAFYQFMAEHGWNITGYYIEWGMNFCGIWDDGIDDSYNIPEDVEEAESTLPYDLIEVFDILETLAQREEDEEDEE